MNNYRQMAVKYLKLNKKRSMVTIIGVAVAVTVLYTMLNLGWCRLLQQRKELREKQDYEIVFMTETAEQVAQLTEDARVKSALVGQYYDYNYYEPVMYENALYINTKHPYRMEKTLEELQNAYGVTGKLNISLAETYMQGGAANMTFVLIIYVLLVSYIFAIFGVGIVRNAIQLSILEQIKDYGNLRCVGSTKKQLKSIVYIQGAILELIGNALGFVLGFLASLIAGYFLKWEVSFHVLPMLPILIAFLGDLYFAMEENCKVIVNMTPVSAIRGEHRIRKEKIKARKWNIFGKLFGVEGDYAYKSLMRNPGRFHKTVWALGVGMAAVMAVMGGTATLRGYADVVDDMSGYYHVYYEDALDRYDTVSDIQGKLPPAAVFQTVSGMSQVTEAKRLYAAEVLLQDEEANYSHYTEAFLKHTDTGKTLAGHYADRESPYAAFRGGGYGITGIICYGYDEMDYARYQQVLVDGTLDVSENGLVLVNGGREWPDSTEGETGMQPDEAGNVQVEYTDYKVGDTIDIVDMAKYRALLEKRVEQLTTEYEKEIAGLDENDEKYDWNCDVLAAEYEEDKYDAARQCWEQLIAEGVYKTYTIEGIVSGDVNHAGTGMIDLVGFGGCVRFVLPLERYFALTGTDESAVTGMQYHFDVFPEQKFSNAVSAARDGTGDNWFITEYPRLTAKIESLQIVGRGILLFVSFVIMMTTFNIINTTASNLHLRRKEFAQLRVIGISKEGLMKMVMLEGVITTLAANIIGIVLGTILSFASFGMVISILYGGRMHFPFTEAVIGIIVSTLILYGSVYIPLKGLKQDMAADLATGGD